MKVAITLSVDSEVKRKVMKIIQQKLGTSVSSYVNDRFIELIESNKPKLNDIFEESIKSTKEVTKCQQ